jgi:shikimate kinase
MTRTLYLIGRSNVGKSTAASALGKLGEIIHVDLDGLLASQNGGRLTVQTAQDWNLVERILRECDAQQTDPRTVVDIGAGTQDRDRAFGDTKLERWLQERRDRVIWIDGDHDELYSRSVAHRDNLRRFDELEYGAKREQLRQSAANLVSFEHSDREESVRRLRAAILTCPAD